MKQHPGAATSRDIRYQASQLPRPGPIRVAADRDRAGFFIGDRYMDDYYRPLRAAYLTDKRLWDNPDAIMIVNFLAAQKRGYVLNQDWLRGEMPIGRDRMKKACALLRRLGYLTTGEAKRTGGKFSQEGSTLNWSMAVSEQTVTTTDGLKTRPPVSPATMGQKPSSHRWTENPTTGNPSNITNMKNKTRTKRCPHGAPPWMDCPSCGAVSKSS